MRNDLITNNCNCNLYVVINYSIIKGTSVQVDEHESKWENHMDIVLKTILQNNKTVRETENCSNKNRKNTKKHSC